MRLGIHAYAWCSRWSNEMLHLIDKVKEYDMDFIEIPLLDLDLFDATAIQERLAAVDMDAVTSTVLSADTNIASDDESVRNNGIAYLKSCVEQTALIEATSFSGVIYSEFASAYQQAPTDNNWKHAAQSLKIVAQHAQHYNVTVGIEPVNRYETNLINTCKQGLALKEMIDEPNIKIHLDTYHMNIEEKIFYETTTLAGEHLIHYHLCENDRGIPGTGTVDWDGVFRALKEINYVGYAGLENFVGLTNTMNTWVWRKLAPSGDVLLAEGVTFIRSMQGTYQLTASTR